MKKTSLVDIGKKSITKRGASAQAVIYLGEELFAKLEADNFRTKKGDIFDISALTGLMASKKCSELIPHCHQINLTKCEVEVKRHEGHSLLVTCSCTAEEKTGVEMEAIIGANLAVICIYDLCKKYGFEMEIGECRLLKKFGGKSDYGV